MQSNPTRYQLTEEGGAGTEDTYDRGQASQANQHQQWDPEEEYGNDFTEASHASFRLMSIQINTFPTHKERNNTTNKAKLHILHELINNSNSDIILTQEDNT